MKKKIRIYSEPIYLLSNTLLALAISMITCTNFGLSAVVAPAYILSEKIIWLSFGKAEYVIQGCLFIVFCLLMKRIKLIYFASFLTGLFYGAVLDFWRSVIPHFNSSLYSPGSLPFHIRCFYFVLGLFLLTFAVTLFYKVYLYPQVYEFFIKGISKRFGYNVSKFKRFFDAMALVTGIVLSLILFHKIVGIGVGTVIAAYSNGIIIGHMSKWMDQYFEFVPMFPKLEKLFCLE